MQNRPNDHRSVRAHTAVVLVTLALLGGSGCQRAIEIAREQHGDGSPPPSQTTAGSNAAAGSPAAGSPAAGSPAAGSPTDAGASTPATQCAAEGGKCVLGSSGCQHRGSTDCNPDRNPGGAFCCLDDASSAVCTDGGTVAIDPKNYNQSCQSATDCTAVPAGDVCFPCIRACLGGVINAQAVGAYRDEIANAVGSSDPSDVRCNCPAEFTPCCLAGQCHAGPECQSATP
jgi:hypothetical protein